MKVLFRYAQRFDASGVIPPSRGTRLGKAAASDVYADDFLYDMQKDPWQLNNVVADPAYADVKAELRERLLNWIQHAEGTRPTITD